MKNVAMDLMCVDCGKKPEEIAEYVLFAEDAEMTPSEYVMQEEGTLNRENGHFLCTDDFLKREREEGARLVGENGRNWVAP